MALLDRFRIGKRKAPPPRRLDHPRDLRLGDIVTFDFAAQAQISNASFTVERIWTLAAGAQERDKRIYFELANGDARVRLHAPTAEQIEVALEALPDTLRQLFREEEIVALLDPDDDALHRLTPRANIPDALRPWVGGPYLQEACLQAHRFEADLRDQPTPEREGSGEIGCDFIRLVAEDRQHAVEFRVFDGGRTEAHLCAQLPRRKIEEMWPAVSF